MESEASGSHYGKIAIHGDGWDIPGGGNSNIFGIFTPT